MTRFLALALLVFCAGCNAQDAATLKTDTAKLAGTVTRVAGNAQLATRVNAALAQRKGVDLSGLHVETKGGVVTLSGSVRDPQERTRVVDAVRGIRGVETVVDRFNIKK
jgi:hypothetical protein